MDKNILPISQFCISWLVEDSCQFDWKKANDYMEKINVLGQLLILHCAYISKYEVPKSSETGQKLEYFSIFPSEVAKIT